MPCRYYYNSTTHESSWGIPDAVLRGVRREDSRPLRSVLLRARREPSLVAAAAAAADGKPDAGADAKAEVPTPLRGSCRVSALSHRVGCAPSRCRCGMGEASPGADVGWGEPRPGADVGECRAHMLRLDAPATRVGGARLSEARQPGWWPAWTRGFEGGDRRGQSWRRCGQPKGAFCRGGSGRRQRASFAKPNESLRVDRWPSAAAAHCTARACALSARAARRRTRTTMRSCSRTSRRSCASRRRASASAAAVGVGLRA